MLTKHNTFFPILFGQLPINFSGFDLRFTDVSSFEFILILGKMESILESTSTALQEKRSVLRWRLISSLLFCVTLLTIASPTSFMVSFTQQLSQDILPNSSQIVVEDECDLFKGHWVQDLNGSLYNSTNCGWIPKRKNCFNHGRRDLDFLNWRWKPDRCELPRFDPRTFLTIVRGKKMAFIGDSVARNQMDSLLCLLSQEVVPTEVHNHGEEYGRTMHFPSYNFTLVFIRSLFLVHGEEAVRDRSKSFDKPYNLHLDKVDNEWAKHLPDTDYAIVSDGHWFLRPHYLYENNTLIGCTNCNQPDITNLGLGFAFQKTFQTVLDYINNSRVKMTILRTYSPSHFENGSWYTGGYCNRTSPLSEGEVRLEGLEWQLRTIQAMEIERLRKQEGGKRFRVLDVTKAMLVRADGHPDSHWDNRKGKGVHDCLHWCLPGPIDAWNEMLLAVMKAEIGQKQRDLS